MQTRYAVVHRPHGHMIYDRAALDYLPGIYTAWSGARRLAQLESATWRLVAAFVLAVLTGGLVAWVLVPGAVALVAALAVSALGTTVH